jgi:hypothetical protein
MLPSGRVATEALRFRWVGTEVGMFWGSIVCRQWECVPMHAHQDPSRVLCMLKGASIRGV